MVSRALALSARSLLSVEPSRRMSMASCLELSKKLFWMVLVTERAPSFSFPAFNHRRDSFSLTLCRKIGDILLTSYKCSWSCKKLVDISDGKNLRDVKKFGPIENASDSTPDKFRIEGWIRTYGEQYNQKEASILFPRQPAKSPLIKKQDLVDQRGHSGLLSTKINFFSPTGTEISIAPKLKKKEGSFRSNTTWMSLLTYHSGTERSRGQQRETAHRVKKHRSMLLSHTPFKFSCLTCWYCWSIEGEFDT